GYSGKVKHHPKRPREDIKRIWQELSVPPWERNRIPLIFYGNKLKSAVGFFRVFDVS
uniref:tRNA lysidine(34) synthetase TilS n=2 Tax=Haemophilus TaxID=724 RepID=UPI0028F11F25